MMMRTVTFGKFCHITETECTISQKEFKNIWENMHAQHIMLYITLLFYYCTYKVGAAVFCRVGAAVISRVGAAELCRVVLAMGDVVGVSPIKYIYQTYYK